MSFRDPEIFTFIFDDDHTVNCTGVLGVFSSENGLKTICETELKVKSFNDFSSITQGEWRKFMKEWEGEMPEFYITEEYIQKLPKEHPYFNCSEGLITLRAIQKYYSEKQKMMWDEFVRMQAGFPDAEQIVERDLWDKDLEEPYEWIFTNHFSCNKDGSWYYSGMEEDLTYSMRDITNIKKLLEFLSALEKEFELKGSKGIKFRLDIFSPS